MGSNLSDQQNLSQFVQFGLWIEDETRINSVVPSLKPQAMGASPKGAPERSCYVFPILSQMGPVIIESHYILHVPTCHVLRLKEGLSDSDRY